MENRYKVFLVALDPKFTKEDLLSFFKSKFPSVIDVNFNQPKKKQRKFSRKRKAKGNGILILNSKSDLDQILSRQGFELGGRRFFCKPYLKGKKLKKFKKDVTRKRVFIHNVSSSMTNKKLRQLFLTYAQIEDAFLINNKTEKTGQMDIQKPEKEQGTLYGYVMFKHLEDAQEIITKGYVDFGPIRILAKAYQGPDGPQQRNSCKKPDKEEFKFVKKDKLLQLKKDNLRRGDDPIVNDQPAIEGSNGRNGRIEQQRVQKDGPSSRFKPSINWQGDNFGIKEIFRDSFSMVNHSEGNLRLNLG